MSADQADTFVGLGIPGFTDPVLIGRGGFGVVYRARQDAFRRDVAIKVLTNAALSDEGKRRFDREVSAMGSLSWHPHIVTIYDAGTTALGHPYLVMEYAPGGSYAHRLSIGGPLSVDETVAIGIAVADALAAAHQAGILHRDLKPDNILQLASGQPALADFGIAALHDATNTRTGIITASVAHAAPEVLNGGRATEAADIYGLGSTLYTLLTGTPAFVRDTDESIIPLVVRATTEPIPDLREHGVPNDLAKVVEQAMAKAPVDRWPTATALAQALSGLDAAPVNDADEWSPAVGPAPIAGSSYTVAREPSGSEGDTQSTALQQHSAADAASRPGQAIAASGDAEPATLVRRPDTGQRSASDKSPSQLKRKRRRVLVLLAAFMVSVVGVATAIVIGSASNSTDSRATDLPKQTQRRTTPTAAPSTTVTTISGCDESTISSNIAAAYQSVLDYLSGVSTMPPAVENWAKIGSFVSSSKADASAPNRTFVVAVAGACTSTSSASFTYDLYTQPKTVTAVPTSGFGLSFSGEAVLDESAGRWVITAPTVCDLISANPNNGATIGNECLQASLA